MDKSQPNFQSPDDNETMRKSNSPQRKDLSHIKFRPPPKKYRVVLDKNGNPCMGLNFKSTSLVKNVQMKSVGGGQI